MNRCVSRGDEMWPMILLPVLEEAVSLLFASIICSYSSFFTTNPSVVVIAWGHVSASSTKVSLTDWSGTCVP